jgi:hypothetical protein
MSEKAHQQTTVRHGLTATHREQALCMAALESREYDAMTDEEWVSLCEKVGKEHLGAPLEGTK